MDRTNTRIVFMGTPDFAVSSLDAILQAGYNVAAVVTVPDRQTGRGLKVTYSPVKQYALDHSLPVLQPEKLRNPEFLEQLRALQADIFVVVAFRMLPKEVWAMPPMGTFNLHASLLPQYRGAAPINWAIINGEKETGVTTFLLNERIDEGEILLQQSTPISPDETAETLHDRLAEIGQNLVVQTLDGLVQGALKPQSQPVAQTLKPAPKIFKPDCAIPWTLPGQPIVDFVRGLSPYPAATMQLIDAKGTPQQFKVYEVAFNPNCTMEPLALATDQKTYLRIGVADGAIEIRSLQISGKKRNTISEFLRGYNLDGWKLLPCQPAC